VWTRIEDTILLKKRGMVFNRDTHGVLLLQHHIVLVVASMLFIVIGFSAVGGGRQTRSLG
jgi:hypothetical protein